MTGEMLEAIAEARRAVLSAPDRQTAVEAYRYWYGLTHSEEHNDNATGIGWLDRIEKNYGGLG